MEKVKKYLSIGWNWLKSRQKATLLAGAAIGAIFDDWIISLIRLLF